MSKNLEKVIQRAISDAAFRRQLQSNPEAALRGFKLTQDEVAALRSADAGKLTSLGIDQRMSKVFSVGAYDGATRSVTGSDLGTSGSGSYSDRDLRQIGDNTSGATGSNQAIDAGNTSGETRMVTGSAGGNTSALDAGAGAAGHTVLVGDPMSERSASSVLRDPENPANARGYIGGETASASTASNIGDPENPANARGYIGEQASAPSSDAIEDQSHSFAATRSADVTGSGLAAPIEGSPEEFSFRDQGASSTASNIGDPDNAAFARGYTGGGAAAPSSDALEDQSHTFAASRDQGASATASNISDPDNAAFARGYTGHEGAAAPSSDALESQSHDFAASRSADVTGTGAGASSLDYDTLQHTGGANAGSTSLDYDTLQHTGGLAGGTSGMAAPIPGSPEEFAFRDQGASTTASNIGDSDNPANARGYIGEQASAPSSDAIEDQSHAFAANRSDAFMTDGEVSQYSDPNLSSDQAEDEGHLFNPNASDAVPEDADTASLHHQPDQPA